MANYNWEVIVSRYTDKDLRKIFKDRDVEPTEKVDAVIVELKKRNLLSDDMASTLNNEENEKLPENPVSYFSKIRPNERRAKIAGYLILTMLGIDIIKIIFDLLQLDLLSDLSNNITVSEQSVLYNTYRQFGWVFLYLTAFVVSTITLIRWIRRAYFNLHLRYSKCKYSEGWAAGCWFVPIVSLYMPYEIMKELWVKTTLLIIQKKNNEERLPGSSIVGWWWTLWIINNVLSNLVSKLNFGGSEIYNLTIVTVITIFTTIISIGLAFITYKMIQQFSRIETECFEMERESNKPVEMTTVQTTF